MASKEVYQAGATFDCGVCSVCYVYNLGLSYGTIKTYLAAIRHLHISKDLPEPRSSPMPKLALEERGIRRVKSAKHAV